MVGFLKLIAPMHFPAIYLVMLLEGCKGALLSGYQSWC